MIVSGASVLSSVDSSAPVCSSIIVVVVVDAVAVGVVAEVAIVVLFRFLRNNTDLSFPNKEFGGRPWEVVALDKSDGLDVFVGSDDDDDDEFDNCVAVGPVVVTWGPEDSLVKDGISALECLQASGSAFHLEIVSSQVILTSPNNWHSILTKS